MTIHIPNYPTTNGKKQWYTRSTICQIRKRRRMKKNLWKRNSDFIFGKFEEQNQHYKKLTNDDFNNYVNEHICDKLA